MDGVTPLLADLRAAGVVAYLRNGLLRCRPASVMRSRPELSAHVRKYKEALLAHLSAQEPQEEISLTEADKTLSRGGAIWIRSDLLGEDFWYTRSPSKAEALRCRGEVVYEPDEIERLWELRDDPDLVRRAHDVKRMFGGRIVPPVECATAGEAVS